MSVMNPFEYQLQHDGYVVIDGAMATELQNRNCDLNDPLWSAKILLEQPELISDIHYDYFVAGASCAITASYQATPLGFLKKGLKKEQSISLIKQSVTLAKAARQRYLNEHFSSKPLIIAGSVGPYGAYLADGSEYTGSYTLTEHEFVDFHYDRIKALIDEGVDIIAFETMPSFAEMEVLLMIMKDFPTIPCWFSFTLQDHLTLSDGIPLKKIVSILNHNPQVISIGINCMPIESITQAIKTLKNLTHKPLIVYPNSGEQYHPSTKQWVNRGKSVSLCHFIPEWIDCGVKLFGGCCRVGPHDIQALDASLCRTKKK